MSEKKNVNEKPSVTLTAAEDAVVVLVTGAAALRAAGYEVLDRYEFPIEDPEATAKAHHVLSRVKGQIAELTPAVSGRRSRRYVSDLTRTVVEAGQSRSNMFIYGPTGSGKTRAVIDGMAALVKLGEINGYYKLPMSPGIEDIDLVTRLVPAKGGVEERRGGLRAIFDEAKNSPVGLLIDEINRTTPRALNIILTSIDQVDGSYTLYDFVVDEEIVVPLENLFIVATANLGGAYSGTNTMDEALLDRFQRTVYWGYDEALEKKLVRGKGAARLHKVAQILRDLYRSGELRSPFSTRHLTGWASLLSDYNDAHMAEEAAMKTFVYRLANVDNYGFPDGEEVNLIISAIREAYAKAKDQNPQESA